MRSLINQSGLTKLCNMVTGAFVGMSLMACNIVYAFAANPWGGASNTLATLFTDLRNSVTRIVIPIAACAFIICFIGMFVTSSQKRHDAFRTWAITIFLCIIGIYAVDFFIGLAQTIGESLVASGTPPASSTP